MPEYWSAERILTAWGLRQLGPMRTPYKVSTGGDASTDDEWQAMRFVERLEHFERAKPVLAHVYANGAPPETFRLREPGETKLKALLRFGWGFLIGRDEKDIPRLIEEGFRYSLREELKHRPFVPVRLEELDVMDIACEMAA
jgi:hypothetical protein